jgi:tetratricopeptide (TPR) repeat protein
MKTVLRLLAVSLSLFFPGALYATPARTVALMNTLQEFIADHDFLGARIIARKIADSGASVPQVLTVRSLLIQNERVGQDLLLSWDKYAHKVSGGTLSPLEQKIEAADQLLLKRNFQAAFSAFQAIAKTLHDQKTKDAQTEILYPYILQAMGRALYGAARYDEALQVYEWITPKYVNFRQVLFERMWTAFRAGKVSIALGAIASQRSAYFSKFLSPESYLVQIYLFKLLCRDGDLKQVLSEIGIFQDELKSGHFDYRQWAKTEIDGRILLSLSRQNRKSSSVFVTNEERTLEIKKIRQLLQKRFELRKKKLLDNLETIKAYSQITISPGFQSPLKSISKLKDRATFFQEGKEIWPVDASEEWADEIGHREFIGESECPQKLSP